MVDMINLIIFHLVFIITVLLFSFVVFNIIVSFKILLRKDRKAFFRKILISQEQPSTLPSVLFGVFLLTAILFVYIFAVFLEFQGHFPLISPWILPIIHIIPITLLLSLIVNTNNIDAILYAFFLPTGDMVVPLTGPIPEWCPFAITNIFWKEGSGIVAQYSKFLRRTISLVLAPFVVTRFFILPFVLGFGGLLFYFSIAQPYQYWWLLPFSFIFILIGIINWILLVVRRKTALPRDKRLKW